MRTFVERGDGLPAWAAPISHAVVVDNVCHVSGQLSLDANGQFVGSTTDREAATAFDNFFAAVRAAGFERSDIVFVDVALSDIDDIAIINTLYAQLFPAGRRPARTVYQVAALPYGGRVKVMGIAIREQRGPSLEDDAAGPARTDTGAHRA